MKVVRQARKRTYRAGFALFAVLALAGLSIAFAVVEVGTRPRHGAADALLTNQVPAAAAWAIALTFFFQFARCRVIASASALTVVHPIRCYVFPWGQVSDVVVGKDGAMRIELRDCSSFDVYCFSGSVIGLITGGIRARKARDGIKAAMEQTAGAEPDSPVTSSLDLQWKVTLGFWGAATALGIAGWLLAPHHVLT